MLFCVIAIFGVTYLVVCGHEDLLKPSSPPSLPTATKNKADLIRNDNEARKRENSAKPGCITNKDSTVDLGKDTPKESDSE